MSLPSGVRYVATVTTSADPSCSRAIVCRSVSHRHAHVIVALLEEEAAEAAAAEGMRWRRREGRGGRRGGGGGGRGKEVVVEAAAAAAAEEEAEAEAATQYLHEAFAVCALADHFGAPYSERNQHFAANFFDSFSSSIFYCLFGV
jgi:hypothetical protein